MTNVREDILRLSTVRLENKVESIMLGINMLLSNPERVDGAVDTMVKMMEDLALAESSLNHSRNLYNQCIALKLKEISKSLESETKTTEE